jgi:hypothetical protein
MQNKIVLAILSCLPAFAQMGAADGSVRETILDATGSATTDAGVKAKNLVNGFERTTASSQSGEFEVPLLLPGRYEVTVSANGE